jgi:phytoene dehydrogenase-like protein
MAVKHDIVIVGGGHNGLITAFYLARAGLKPLVLERRPVVGGAAITDEFFPGFKCSILTHTGGPLRADILKEMQLERHGLHIIRPNPRVFSPTPDGRALILYDDPSQSAREIARFSKTDAEKYPELQTVLARLATVINRVLSEAPPSLDHPSSADYWNLLKTGKALRGLGNKDMYRLLRWGPMPVADLVAEWFETEPLCATVAARGIFGTFLGPRSAGSSAVLLLRAAADPHPGGASLFAKGGMGSVTQAMATAATQAGAAIRTGAEVSRIVARNGVVTGIVLSGGEEIAAKTVISNADPRTTFLRLIDPDYLSPDFLAKMQNYRCNGTVAKVNLALSGLPSFTALKKSADTLDGASALAGRIHIGPEMDYMERALDAAKYGDFSPHPILEIRIPSLADPSLAPPGQHVMSIYVQFAPYRLKTGDWVSKREALGDVVVKTISDYAPDLPRLVLHRQVVTPLDLEEIYGLSGGHIFHGELSLDQLFTMRPLLGWAQYRTPLNGLYLCGSGTHPGAGLTGASGSNAARQILTDLQKRK